MIGDWVLHDGEPYQIRQLGIYGVDRDGEDYPAVCVGKPKGIGLIIERNEIAPISLTPEILEKNGWSSLGEYRYEGDIALAKGRNYFRLKNTTICINSVHELQHVLRLCGINKEIEI